MLEIIETKEYTYGEIIAIEKRFTLNGDDGKYLYEENWYEPMEYRFMKITWKDTVIINDYGYKINGSIPSDDELKELSNLDRGLDKVIENGNYTKL